MNSYNNFRRLDHGIHIEFLTKISIGILEGMSIEVLEGIPGRHFEKNL